MVFSYKALSTMVVSGLFGKMANGYLSYRTVSGEHFLRQGLIHHNPGCPRIQDAVQDLKLKLLES